MLRIHSGTREAWVKAMVNSLGLASAIRSRAFN